MNEIKKQTINISEIFEMIKRRWIFIAIVTIISIVATGILSFWIIEPKYETVSKVFIGKEENNEDGYNSNDIQMYQKLLKTYSEAIQTTDLVERALKDSDYELNIEDVLSSLNVIALADTQILEISYESKNPEEAEDTLSKIVLEFINTSKQLVPNGSVTIIQKVRLPQDPVSPNKAMNIAIALVLGLIASIGIVILMEYMNNTFKNKSEIEKEFNVPVVGVIPQEDVK